MNFDGQDSFLHFYVCEVPYCVVSVGRLLGQGYRVQLSSEEYSLANPEGCRIPVERHDSLLTLVAVRRDPCRRLESFSEVSGLTKE